MVCAVENPSRGAPVQLERSCKPNCCVLSIMCKQLVIGRARCEGGNYEPAGINLMVDHTLWHCKGGEVGYRGMSNTHICSHTAEALWGGGGGGGGDRGSQGDLASGSASCIQNTAWAWPAPTHVANLHFQLWVWSGQTRQAAATKASMFALAVMPARVTLARWRSCKRDLLKRRGWLSGKQRGS